MSFLKSGDISEAIDWKNELSKAWTSSEGAGGVMFLQSQDDSVFVLKASSSVVEETFANCILQCMNVPTAEVRVINSTESEWGVLKDAVQICVRRENSKNNVAKAQKLENMLNGALDRAQLMIIKFIDGHKLEGLRNAEEMFSLDQNSKQASLEAKLRLQQFGMITMADMFLNNSDRVPLPCWNNGVGNAGNLMVNTTSGIFAIDSVVNTLDPEGEISSSFYQRYHDRVQETLREITFSHNESLISESEVFGRISGLIFMNTGYQLKESELLQIRKGMLQTIKNISKIAETSVISDVHQYISKMYPESWLNGWAEGAFRIKLGYFEKISELFRSAAAQIPRKENIQLSIETPPKVFVPPIPSKRKKRNRKVENKKHRTKLEKAEARREERKARNKTMFLFPNRPKKANVLSRNVLGSQKKTLNESTHGFEKPNVTFNLNELRDAKLNLKVNTHQQGNNSLVLLQEAAQTYKNKANEQKYKNEKESSMLQVDMLLKTMSATKNSKIWKLDSTDTLEAASDLINLIKPSMVVFDFDQTLTEPFKGKVSKVSMNGTHVRGGEASIRALERVHRSGVPSLIITANKPSAGSALSICNEIRNLGLGTMFNVSKPDLTRFEKTMIDWGANETLSNKQLTLKLMCLIIIYTDRVGNDLPRVSASSVRVNADGMPESFALRSNQLNGQLSAPQKFPDASFGCTQLHIMPCLSEYISRTEAIRARSDSNLDSLFIDCNLNDTTSPEKFWENKPMESEKVRECIGEFLLNEISMSDREIDIFLSGEAKEFTTDKSGIKLAVAGNLICSGYNKPEALEWYLKGQNLDLEKVIFFDDSTANVFNMFNHFRTTDVEMHSCWYPPPSHGKHEKVDPLLHSFVERAGMLQKYSAIPTMRVDASDNPTSSLAGRHNVVFKDKDTLKFQNVTLPKNKNTTVNGTVEVKVLIIQETPTSAGKGADLVRRSLETTQNTPGTYNTVDFVVLPEGFVTETLRLDDENDVLEPYARIALEYSLYIVCGTMLEPTEDGKKFYTTSVVLGPFGKRLGMYRKRRIHNHQMQEAGSGVGIFNTIYGKIGVLICLDIEDETLLEETIACDTKLIFNPIHIPVPGKISSSEKHVSKWRHAVDEIGKKLEYFCKTHACVIFRCDTAFPNGVGSSQIIGPFFTEVVGSSQRELLVGKVLLDVGPDGQQLLNIPKDFSRIPSSSYERQDERMNIGPRCKINWLKLKDIKSPIIAIQYLGDSKLAVISEQGTILIVNTVTLQVEKATENQKKVLKQYQIANESKTISTADFAWIDINRSTGNIVDGKIFVWEDAPKPILRHIISRSWPLRFCARNHVSGEFATVSAVPELIALWKFT